MGILDGVMKGLGGLLGDNKQQQTKSNTTSSGTQEGSGSSFGKTDTTGETSNVGTTFGDTTSKAAPWLTAGLNDVSGWTPGYVNANQYQIGGADNLAGLGTGATLGTAFGAGNAIAGSGIGDPSRYMSPYISQVVNPMLQAQDTQNRQALQAIRGNQAAKGALGNNTGNRAENLYYQGVMPGQQAAIASLYNQGFQQSGQLSAQDAQARLAGATGLGALTNTLGGLNAQLGTAGGNIAGTQLSNEQLQLAAMQGKAGATSQLANQLGQTTVGQNTNIGKNTQGTTTNQGYTNQGSYTGNQNTQGTTNSQGWNGGEIVGGLGKLAGTLFGAFSDARIKEGVDGGPPEEIGESKMGDPIYLYRKLQAPDFETLGPPEIGLIAQDVEQRDPGAVGETGAGIKTVDYPRALGGGRTARPERPREEGFADGGAVGSLGGGSNFMKHLNNAFKFMEERRAGGAVNRPGYEPGGVVGGGSIMDIIESLKSGDEKSGSGGMSGLDLMRGSGLPMGGLIDVMASKGMPSGGLMGMGDLGGLGSMLGFSGGGGVDPSSGDVGGGGNWMADLGDTLKGMGKPGGKDGQRQPADDPMMRAPDLMGQGFQRLSAMMQPPKMAWGGGVQWGSDGFKDWLEQRDAAAASPAPVSEPEVAPSRSFGPYGDSPIAQHFALAPRAFRETPTEVAGARDDAPNPAPRYEPAPPEAPPYRAPRQIVPQSQIGPMNMSGWNRAMNIISHMGGPAGSGAKYELELNRERLAEIAAQAKLDELNAGWTGQTPGGQPTMDALTQAGKARDPETGKIIDTAKSIPGQKAIEQFKLETQRDLEAQKHLREFETKIDNNVMFKVITPEEGERRKQAARDLYNRSRVMIQDATKPANRAPILPPGEYGWKPGSGVQ